MLGLLLLAARDQRVMGDYRIGVGLAMAGWLVTALVTAAGALYLWYTFAPLSQ